MFDVLMSGFAGAVIGATIVWYVGHREQVIIAKHRLRILLLGNGYEIWYGSKREPWQVIDSNRVEVHAAYLALCVCVLPWRRAAIGINWKEYTGVEYYDDLPDDEPSKITK